MGVIRLPQARGSFPPLSHSGRGVSHKIYPLATHREVLKECLTP